MKADAAADYLARCLPGVFRHIEDDTIQVNRAIQRVFRLSRTGVLPALRVGRKVFLSNPTSTSGSPNAARHCRPVPPRQRRPPYERHCPNGRDRRGAGRRGRSPRSRTGSPPRASPRLGGRRPHPRGFHAPGAGRDGDARSALADATAENEAVLATVERALAQATATARVADLNAVRNAFADHCETKLGPALRDAARRFEEARECVVGMASRYRDLLGPSASLDVMLPGFVFQSYIRHCSPALADALELRPISSIALKDFTRSLRQPIGGPYHGEQPNARTHLIVRSLAQTG